MVYSPFAVERVVNEMTRDAVPSRQDGAESSPCRLAVRSPAESVGSRFSVAIKFASMTP